MASLLHRIALAQTAPKAISEDEPERARLFELARAFTAENTQLFYQIAIHGRSDIELAPDEYAGFTMTLMRMLAFSPSREIHSAVPATNPPVKIAPVSAPAELSPPISASMDEAMLDWVALTGRLKVQAMAQQLAKHCVLDSFSNDHLVLHLAEENKHLQTRMAADNLQAALRGHFGRPIRLTIVLGKVSSATPAKIEQQNQQERQDQANSSIVQDDFVKDAQAALGASLVPGSIKPVQ
jgi:DNA polymerase-3 subunit gamma/tau